MKTITKLSVLLSMLFCLNIQAQHKSGHHKSGPLGEDNIINTKRELKKEKRVHESSSNVAKSNEHSARKHHKLGTKLFHKPNKRKMKKQTEKQPEKQADKVAVNNKKN
jgi:hypothetical protein